MPNSPQTPPQQPPQQPPLTVDAHPEMRIVQPSLCTTMTSSFKLPSDWTVEVRPRGTDSPISSDKYYYEPGTGRKFRSLISVKRYLNGEIDPPPTKKPSKCLVPYNNTGSVKRVIYGGKVLTPVELEEARYANLEDIRPETLQFRSAVTLPDGWIVEEVPRKCGLRSDRYYIDPVTGQKFRSILEVHRFLEGHLCKPKRKASTLSSNSTTPRSPVPRKKKASNKTVKGPQSEVVNPPKTINWLYSGNGKDNWSPLVEECVLPNYVAEQWSETFMLGMNGCNDRAPQLTLKDSSDDGVSVFP